MSTARARLPYGPHPRQFVDLTLPPGDAPLPLVVLVHGGFWSNAFALDLMDPLHADLDRWGRFATANLEYRSLGDDGGGWPGTLDDVAAALDLLADQPRLDVTRVAVVGHSAGGHLAAWLAARPSLPPGAPGHGARVVPRLVVSQAGVLDLTAGAAANLGGGACAALLGGVPDAFPARYATASPRALIPMEASVIAIHGRDDPLVPFSQSADFVAAATAAGMGATLLAFDGGHFEVLDPEHETWRWARSAIRTSLFAPGT